MARMISARPPGPRQGRLSARLWLALAAVCLLLALSGCAPSAQTAAPPTARAETAFSAAPTQTVFPESAKTETTISPTDIVISDFSATATSTPALNRALTRAPTRTATRAPTSTPTLTPTPTLLPGWVRVPAGTVQVPILMYHHVSDKLNTRYAITLSTFRAQMAILHDQGYQTVSVSQLADVIRAGGSLPAKPVVITFDDGYLDTYANAFPIMEEFGFTGTVYIITSTLEEGQTYGYMQAAQLKALVRAGWEIGSHSVTHTNLKETKLGVGNEMRQSKAALEKLLGISVHTFSYPYAVSTEAIRARAEAAGYDSAVGVDILVTNTPRRLYYLSRREVQRSTSLAAFKDLLAPSADEIAWLAASQAAEQDAAP